MRKPPMDPRDSFPQDARLRHRCGGSTGVGSATVNAGLRAANCRIPRFFALRSWCRAPPRSPRCSTGPPPTPKPAVFRRPFAKVGALSIAKLPADSARDLGITTPDGPLRTPSTPRGPPFMPRSARSAAVGDAQITELAKVAELPNGLVTESGKRGPSTRRGQPEAR